MTIERLDFDAVKAALASHRERFDRFAQLLIEHNRTTNLTRIDSPEQIQIRHFLDSLAALSVLDKTAAAVGGMEFSLIDVGSGAGFPGLALAIARPYWRIVSLEATDKKARFQQQVCRELGLANVEVIHGRAEVMAHDPQLRERFNVATARAVAGLDVLAELMIALVRTGGIGLFWKGSQVQDELIAAEKAFEKMGSAITQLCAYRLPKQPSDAESSMMYLVAAEKHTPTPAVYPRQNFGSIKKRPLC